jgi:hypothetical protein
LWCLGGRGRCKLFEVARVGRSQSVFGFAGDDLEWDAVTAHQQQAFACPHRKLRP